MINILTETLAEICPLDAAAQGAARARQGRLTKPPGALGVLEDVSVQLAGLARMCPAPLPDPAAVAIFAADHGVHAQGVTPWPREVTAQMVANFLAGGAAVNAFAAEVAAEVRVIDVGVAAELEAMARLGNRKVVPGTADMSEAAAMDREDAVAGVEAGIEEAGDLVAGGFRCLIAGDMGIANTTPAAALIAAFTGRPAREVTGRGAGIDESTWSRKVKVIERALARHRPDPGDALGVLAAVGGLEHAALTGFILGAARHRIPVLLDGVSTVAAALVARALTPDATGAMLAGHRSTEPGAAVGLTALGLRPLVHLDMRLGEGTGGLLALPIVRSAARVLRDMQTFDKAGVTQE